MLTRIEFASQRREDRPSSNGDHSLTILLSQHCGEWDQTFFLQLSSYTKADHVTHAPEGNEKAYFTQNRKGQVHTLVWNALSHVRGNGFAGIVVKR